MSNEKILRPRLKNTNDLSKLKDNVTLICKNIYNNNNLLSIETYFKYLHNSNSIIHKLFISIQTSKIRITLNVFTENGYFPIYHIEINEDVLKHPNNILQTDMVSINKIIEQHSRHIEKQNESFKNSDIFLINELCENFYN